MKTLMRRLDAFNRGTTTAARWLADLCVAAMIVIVFCGVLWRYVLRDPLSWVDEMAALLLVVISFLGCHLAMHKKKLARIDLLISRFGGRARTVAYVVSECLSLVMVGVVIYYGTKLFFLPTSLRQRTSGMYIPLWFFYGLIPLTFVGNAILTVANILHYFLDDEEKIAREIAERENIAL
ncbi:MAG: TRAP transporter small permease [Planctomycetota bacterium]|nr:TRAP transporter small permease [Planctomycetota bacterium]